MVNASWNGGYGAVTWGSGTAGVKGTISASNSLIGATANDHVGGGYATLANGYSVGGSVTVLSNGNYVVASPLWSNQTGAVTWGSGTAGVKGTISASNSLVGSGGGDLVGARTDDGAGDVYPGIRHRQRQLRRRQPVLGWREGRGDVGERRQCRDRHGVFIEQPDRLEHRR